MIPLLRPHRSVARPLLVLCGLLAVGAHGSAAENKSPPAEVRVGAYVNALSDLNSTNNTFIADFWIWAVHPRTADLRPLKTAEFENARDYRLSLETTEDYGTERYHAAKIRGVFNHAWDVRNFPYDRHQLTIALSEAQLEDDRVRYVVDAANTTFDPALVIEGWRIEKVGITTGTNAYQSNFGVPGKVGGSRYATTTLSIFIRREAGGLFLKLHAAVYIIFIVSLVTFLMDSSKDGFFSARIGLISGMILATVVNSHRVAATLGGNNRLTLPDKIHIVTLLVLLIALLVSLATRRLHALGKSPQAQLLDRVAAPVCLVAYVAINLALVQIARAS
ncbi:MAG: hypothetical protein H7343_06960 [Undibacterium sp.]|nr:hypothetical protein [Opitutaceae bacterium]